MKNVIMTGATGEIGLALVEELLLHNINVTVIVRPDSKRVGRLPQNEHVNIVKCELGKLHELLSSEKQLGTFDVFYHLGWDYSREHNNVNKQILNINDTLKAADLAVQLGCDCFVGAGSQAEYGRVDGEINENTPCFPETAYGIAKYSAGRMCELFCMQKRIRYVWPRIFSVYGPGDAESTMIMSVIRQLLEGKVPALTKGEQMWDYLYTSDAAKALWLLGENNTCNGIYCIGSGAAKPLRLYVEELRDSIGKELLLDFGAIPYAEKQVMNLSVSIHKLMEDTAFRPEVSFNKGIRQTILWCKKHPLTEKFQ